MVEVGVQAGKQCIVACLDGAALSQDVCDYSIWLAQTLQLPVCFLHVIEHSQQATQTDLSGAIGLGASESLLTELTAVEQFRSQLLRRQGQLMLGAAREKAIAGGVDVTIEQRHGTFVERLVEMEETLAYAVVGIPKETAQDEENTLGAQLETLIRSMQSPILVVNGDFTVPKTFMLAYDGSEASGRALSLVAGTSAFRSYTWVLAQAYQESQDQVLSHAKELLTDNGFDNIVLEARQNKPEDALAFCQDHNDVDITVMGAYSHHPLRGFIFGSFTRTMLRRTRKPLLLIHE